MSFDLARLQEELIRDEGLELAAYRDSLSYWTIGIGRLIDARRGGGITREEALYLFGHDVERKAAELDEKLPWWRTVSPVRQRVLLNMAFNLGVDGLLGFHKALAAMRAGRHEDAAREMLDSDWYKQVGERAERLAEMWRMGGAG